MQRNLKIIIMIIFSFLCFSREYLHTISERKMEKNLEQIPYQNMFV